MKIDSKVKNLDKSQVEITASIGADDFMSFESASLAAIGADVEFPGFRKGNVPEAIIKKNISEMRILEEMAERAIMQAYPEILESEKIDAIGRPEITLTKIARGNPLEFKIITAVIPTVKLGNYKKTAAGIEKTEAITVTDEDVEKTVKEVQKMRAQKEKKEGEEISEDSLPALDDAFVKTLGSFNDVEDFKTKIRENMRMEKEHQAKEKRRLAIVEALVAGAEIELPEVLGQSEVEKMIHRLKVDIEQIGFTFDAYLKQINKTEDDIRKEWLPEAEKRAKLQLVIQKIAEEEKIVPDKEEVEHELSHLLEHYKDADKIRARMHIEQTLTTEKVFRFLEEQ